MTPSSAEHRDFFISYTAADETWAQWIADTLESNGYKVYIQAWDFRPGNNFVLEMQAAAENTDRTLFVLSADSLKSQFVKPEWAAAFVQDPTGMNAKLIPVLIAPCRPTGLLASIVHIDLLGLDEAAATRKLLDSVGRGRAKPAEKVAFPGTISAVTLHTAPDGTQPLDWTSLSHSLVPVWRANQGQAFGYQPTCLEIYAIPVVSRRVEVRRLATLADDLISLGRERGLFSISAAVDARHDTEAATAISANERDQAGSGISITRDGQRGVWVPLPKDGLGPVYDPVYVENEIRRLLVLLLSLPVEHTDDYAFALAITSPMMLTINDVSVVGKRTSSGGMRMQSDPIRFETDDYISYDAWVSRAPDVAEELAARLSAAVRAGH